MKIRFAELEFPRLANISPDRYWWHFNSDERAILFSKFYNFFTFILEANSYYPRGLILREGNSPNSKNGWDSGVSVPGAFKLNHLQPVNPILLQILPHFSCFRPRLSTFEMPFSARAYPYSMRSSEMKWYERGRKGGIRRADGRTVYIERHLLMPPPLSRYLRV